MVRCIFCYRAKQDEVGNRGFWDHLESVGSPLYGIQAGVKQDTNYLANFLANGDQQYQIIHRKNARTTLEDLNRAFEDHMLNNYRKPKASIGRDYHPIKAAGFKVTKPNFCKQCHEICSKSSCGEHYNPDNRYRKTVIEGMAIVRAKRMGDDLGGGGRPTKRFRACK